MQCQIFIALRRKSIFKQLNFQEIKYYLQTVFHQIRLLYLSTTSAIVFEIKLKYMMKTNVVWWIPFWSTERCGTITYRSNVDRCFIWDNCIFHTTQFHIQKTLLRQVFFHNVELEYTCENLLGWCWFCFKPTWKNQPLLLHVSLKFPFFIPYIYLWKWWNVSLAHVSALPSSPCHF